MRSFRLAFVVAAGTLLLTACATTGSGSKPGGAPDFTLNSTEGRPVRLSKYTGDKVVMLNFWGTWCAPCQAEMPHLEALYQKYKDQGFIIMGVAMDGPETMANVPLAARRQGITFPVLLDPETRAVMLYNPTRAAPFNVIIGRDGKIAMTREGFGPGDAEVIENAVVLALNGSAVPAAPATMEAGSKPPCHGAGAAPEAATKPPCHTVEPAAAPAAKAE